MSALVPTLLAIVALSLLMVHAMVRFSRVMITRAERRPEQGGALEPGGWTPALRWGTAYALLWAALVAAFLLLIEITGEEMTRKNVLLLAGIPAAWLAVNAVLIVFARAIIRANQRDFQAGRTRRVERDFEEEAAAAELAGGDLLSGAAGPAWPEVRTVLGRKVRGLLASLATALAALVAIAVGEAIPPLKRLEAVMAARQGELLAVTVPLLAVGFVLFMAGIIHLVLTTSQGDSATLAEVKAAFRARAWRASRRWRRLFVIMTGAALMTLGLFGTLIVVGTAGIKLLLGGALLYALVNVTAAFVRA